jgi:hypothetical protein
MSNLRLAGIFVGFIGLLITFLRYRGPQWKRRNFLLFSLLNFSIIVVSVFPGVVNYPRDILSLGEYIYGRLLALLIISNLFLLFFSFYIKSKHETIRFQFDKLVRNLGAFNLGDQLDFKDKIKPIMILIPAYNESENLNYLLPNIPQRINNIEVGVLVVNDGSDDNTADIVQSNGQLVISNLINRGGGAALRLGYDILERFGRPICVTMDADGQHRPDEIEKLLEPILSDRLDFVIGSRILGEREKDSSFRLFGVYVFGFIISLLLGKKITDPSSNFRAFKMDAMKAIQLHEDQYHTSELIIEVVKKGMHIGEVPITILNRKFGKSKKGKDVIYGLHFARVILKTWWR